MAGEESKSTYSRRDKSNRTKKDDDEAKKEEEEQEEEEEDEQAGAEDEGEEEDDDDEEEEEGKSRKKRTRDNSGKEEQGNEKSPYEKDEKVLAYHGKLLYEAKVSASKKCFEQEWVTFSKVDPKLDLGDCRKVSKLERTTNHFLGPRHVIGTESRKSKR